ncbi:ROK family protein [Peptostreptococcus canis]|uniref:ROK family protein n=1 Tax=Peptostreptococcus canis TaxID=1159213 RepID=A0ABR6TN54_9FIRM|nr:ROK family protein [Peptostreptococcus canis]MBC2576855.1 ROK family protein [Peptostreptococcus canis]MBP1998623.1 putative NBD/HSP70 family sugar kinase [Peptostreptococcus canis]
MKKYMCFDIGGTNIKFGVLDENGNIIIKDSVDSEARIKGGPGIIDKIVDITKKYMDKYNLSGVAISCAGMIDSINGSVMFADEHLIPNFTGIKIKEIIKKQTGLLCEIENDVNAAGLGELWFGMDSNSSLVAMLTIGTGIGACLIKDNRLITGNTMCAGEIGKTLIPGGRFEDIASSFAMTSKLEKKLGLKDGELNGKIVFEEIEKGNKIYIDAVDEMINNLAIGISNLCFIFNPGIIILGGGIMARENYFKPRLEDAIKKYLPKVISDGTELRFAKLKNDAGMIGALKNFLNKH